MSYFAKPYFISYDEWFDDDLEKTQLNSPYQEVEIYKIHDFFYDLSKPKIGASENQMELNIGHQQKKIYKNMSFKNNSENYLPYKEKYSFTKDLSKSKFIFKISKRLFYFLSLITSLIVIGCFLFLTSLQKEKDTHNFKKTIETYQSF